jgi:hypothetical protein
MRDVKKIIDGAFSFGMIQNYKEIYEAVDFIVKQNISNFLEIGTNQGGTFYAWTCACETPGVRVLTFRTESLVHRTTTKKLGTMCYRDTQEIVCSYPDLRMIRVTLGWQRGF